MTDKETRMRCMSMAVDLAISRKVHGEDVIAFAKQFQEYVDKDTSSEDGMDVYKIIEHLISLKDVGNFEIDFVSQTGKVRYCVEKRDGGFHTDMRIPLTDNWKIDRWNIRQGSGIAVDEAGHPVWKKPAVAEILTSGPHPLEPG